MAQEDVDGKKTVGWRAKIRLKRELEAQKMRNASSEKRDKPDAPVITLVTPMYNESERIKHNIRNILDALKNIGVSWEYILVDDGSTDDSLKNAKEALNGEPSCRVIHYEANRGRGYALRKGFDAARGKFVISTESDLSWGPSIIGKIYNALLSTNADVVIASVHLTGGGMENVPLFRSLLSKAGNRATKKAFGGKLTMITGMTRGYRREAIKSLLLEENDKEIHLEIISKAQALGYKIVEIPATISWEPPGEGGRAKGGFGILRFVSTHLLVLFQRASVRLLARCAVAFGFLGAFTVVLSVFHKIHPFLPYQLPNLATYGLIIFLTAILLLAFTLLSIQIDFLHRSVVHIQSQLNAVSDLLKNGDDAE
jgi:glycosyltransferase involved in cell wall biosynthesis